MYFCMEFIIHRSMSKRSAFGVFLFSFFFTFFYQIYWFVQTKEEMCELGCEIPTSWLMIVPFASIYWDWKYCEAVESVSLGKYSTGMIFLLLQLKWFFAIILIVVVLANGNTQGEFTPYLKYIVLAASALSVAILQSIFNSIDESLLFSKNKWSVKETK